MEKEKDKVEFTLFSEFMLLPKNTNPYAIKSPYDGLKDYKEVPETFKEAFKRISLNILKKIGIILILMIVVVLITLGLDKLDNILGTGHLLRTFSYCISLFIGIVTSMIIFET